MDDKIRGMVNAACACKVIPAHHFDKATIERCWMHDHAPDFIEDLDALGVFDGVNTPTDLTGAWLDIQLIIAEVKENEIPANNGPGL